MPKRRKSKSRHSFEMWKKQKFPSNLTQKDIEDVEVLFRKRHKYRSLFPLMVASEDAVIGSCPSAATAVEDWIGENPTLKSQVTPDPELISLKHDLNTTKDQLSSRDIETWHEHTTNCNIAARIIPYVKSQKVELCTQAWVKFYEILSTFSIVPKQTFLSVHLCEAPGAFVTSLCHYLQRIEFKHIWDWRATTLNPYHEANTMGEMVSDDRLIRNTYSQWFFGRDGSGDITADNHVRDLCSLIQQVAEDEELSPLLVTADGSKDCQINPAEQESQLSRLHYCEMVCACLVLAQGGCFVFKVFTMFEPASVALLFLLNVMFAEVHATKPSTSKSGNSEIYLVCLNYRKNVREGTLWKLLDLTVYSNAGGTVNFLSDLPVDFLQDHRLCCRSFARWQADTIRRNIELFEDMGPETCRRLQGMQALAVDKFVELTGIYSRCYFNRVSRPHTDRSAFTVKYLGNQPPAQGRPDWHHKNLKGTFHLRQNVHNMAWLDRVRLIEIRSNPQPNMLLESNNGMMEEEDSEWMDVEMGKAVSVIESSRLCDLDLMTDLTLLLRNTDIKACRQQSSADHVAKLAKMLSNLVLDTCTPSRSPSSSNSVIYWVGGTLEKDSPVYKSLTGNCQNTAHIQHICTEDDFASLSSLPDKDIQVVCNVTAFGDDEMNASSDLACEELATRGKFIQLVTKLLSHLTHCHRLVLLAPTFLSRLSAGLLYILARSFHTTSICGEANMWLHQFVVFEDYTGTSPALLEHLVEVNRLIENPGETTVVEVVKFSCLLTDWKFVQFVTALNNFTVAGFINEMLQYYKVTPHQDG